MACNRMTSGSGVQRQRQLHGVAGTLVYTSSSVGAFSHANANLSSASSSDSCRSPVQTVTDRHPHQKQGVSTHGSTDSHVPIGTHRRWTAMAESMQQQHRFDWTAGRARTPDLHGAIYRGLHQLAGLVRDLHREQVGRHLPILELQQGRPGGSGECWALPFAHIQATDCLTHWRNVGGMGAGRAASETEAMRHQRQIGDCAGGRKQHLAAVAASAGLHALHLVHHLAQAEKPSDAARLSNVVLSAGKRPLCFTGAVAPSCACLRARDVKGGWGAGWGACWGHAAPWGAGSPAV